jgi:hypothetical protein
MSVLKLKAPYWDRDGFALWAKRLVRGRFAPPQGDGGAIGRAELALLLEGVSVLVVRRSPRWANPAAIKFFKLGG